MGLTAAVLVGSVLVPAAVAAPDPAADRFSLHQAGDGYAFSTPAAMASYGGNLFVVNRGGNTVTELNASTGTWVRTIPTVVRATGPVTAAARAVIPQGGRTTNRASEKNF